MQRFKGDATEEKMIGVAEPIMTLLSEDKDDFYEGSYETVPLGELIYDSGRAPLSNAILRDIFIHSFKELFESFRSAGTFESYISVFKKIFGDDVEIDFTVPAPGKLTIDIQSMNFELSPFVARHIELNEYVFYYIIDFDDDRIVFQTIQGFTSEYDLRQMLFEMVPAGVFTQINLV